MTRVAPCVYGFIICERERYVLRSLIIYLLVYVCLQLYIYESYIPGGRCL